MKELYDGTRWRALAGTFIALFLLCGSFDARFLAVPFMDRAPLRQELQSYPDLGAETYPRFLREVQRRTPPGTSVAVVVPMRHWDPGYRYAFYRASYLLAGRTVIPLVDADDRLHLERIAQSNWIACWKCSLPAPAFRLAWQSREGTLWSRP